MSGTLADHGIHPLAETESEAGSVSDFRRVLDHSINLRDLGDVTPRVRQGLVLRSSQVVSPLQLRKLGVQSIIDLRQAPVACRVHTHNVSDMFKRWFVSVKVWFQRSVMGRKPVHAMSRKRLLLEQAVLLESKPCWRCTQACEDTYGVKAQVYHVDLLPGAVSFFIFAALPHYLQAKVLYLVVRKQKPEALVAAAVADPQVLGFFKLYKIILERSKTNVAAALRLLLQDDHLPVLIHCVHGKDRTGLIAMLIYLICRVPREVIVADYARSESLLRESREKRELLDLPVDLTRDQVIASVASVMEATLDYLQQRYGDVDNYLMSAGMEQEEIDGIREKMMPAMSQNGMPQNGNNSFSNGTNSC